MIDKLEIDAYLVLGAENKRYCSGFTGTTCEVLLTKNKNYIITDGRYELRSKEEVNDDFEIIIINTSESYHTYLINLIKKENIKTLGFDGKMMSFAKYKNFENDLEGVALTSIESLIEKQRVCKTEEELEKIKKAVEITDKTFTDFLGLLKEGMTEIEAKNLVDHRHIVNGGEKASFDTIMAFGENTALPHASPTNRKLKKGDIVTIDFGVFYKGYCSDMTRTFFFGEPNEKELVDIHNIVREAHELQLSEVCAGKTVKEIDKLGRDYIASKGYGDKFIHGTGHGVGLEIHEAPTVNSSSDEILKAGMVITIEPGIYVEGLGGVRIENDVIVTETGYISLNKSSKEHNILA